MKSVAKAKVDKTKAKLATVSERSQWLEDILVKGARSPMAELETSMSRSPRPPSRPLLFTTEDFQHKGPSPVGNIPIVPIVVFSITSSDDDGDLVLCAIGNWRKYFHFPVVALLNELGPFLETRSGGANGDPNRHSRLRPAHFKSCPGIGYEVDLCVVDGKQRPARSDCLPLTPQVALIVDSAAS